MRGRPCARTACKYPKRSCSRRLGFRLFPRGVFDLRARRGLLGLRRFETRARQHARLLEYRISDRADVRIDPPQISEQIKMQRRCFDALDRVAGKTAQMRVGVRALEIAKQHLLCEQLLRALQIAVQKNRKTEPQICDEPRMKVADL